MPINAAKDAFEQGERKAELLRQFMRKELDGEPLAHTQYVSCADYDTLQEWDQVTGKTLLSMAVVIGKTRLIDNMVLE